MARLNPQGLAEAKRRFSSVALAGAQGASGQLREELSQEGLGRKHPNLPNRSSTRQEYPSLQSGQLRESIGAREAGEMKAEFGPIVDPPEYVGDLHFKPPADGGRPFMDMALHDPDIHDAVLDAVEREAGRQFGRVRVRRGS